MKKMLLLGCATALMLCVSACSYVPKIIVDFQTNPWVENDVRVKFPEGYEIDPGHIYDLVETEDGYDLIIHLHHPD